MCNYIFFYDSKGQNKWILCQCTSFVDAIISTTYSGKHNSSVADDTILGSLRKILREEVKNSTKHLPHKAIFAGYSLDQTRPYHHFYDQLKWFIYLQDNKPILSEKSFFCPKNLSKKILSKPMQALMWLFFLLSLVQSTRNETWQIYWKDGKNSAKRFFKIPLRIKKINKA